jgi:LysR family transcriptional regulator, low CO2-responsive transcriptional regulator
MEDHRLKSYCLVVETKSFSRAAQAKHMTQSAMSRLIKGLEDELGVKLLLREGKTVNLTPEGKIFYDHAKKLLEGYVRLEQDISSAAGAARGSLRLGSSRTPAFHLLSQALYDFSKKHPELRIDLTIAKTEGVLRELREGRIDLGIVESRGLEEKFFAETLAEDEIVLIAPENHRLAAKRAITLQDLVSQPFILPGRGSGTRAMVDDYFEAQGIDARLLNVRMTVGSPEFVVRMVQAGLGVAFASKWSVFSAVKEGTIKVLRLPGKKILRKFYIVTIDREPASAAARTFKEFIRQHRFFVPF